MSGPKLDLNLNINPLRDFMRSPAGVYTDMLLDASKKIGTSGPSFAEQLQERGMIKDAAFRDDLLKAKEEGTVSNQTIDEIMGQLNSSNYNVTALKNMFMAEKEGTSKVGRSRLATQKLYETIADQPGRAQTLLTPRSNTSRGILGV